MKEPSIRELNRHEQNATELQTCSICRRIDSKHVIQVVHPWYAENNPFYAGIIALCCDCGNAIKRKIREHNKRLRKETLEQMPRCERCGIGPANWTIAHVYHVCGRCKTAIKKEHAQNMANTGGLAFIAYMDGAIMIDTSTWKNRPGNKAAKVAAEHGMSYIA